jgi:hypothetical protein
MFAAMDSGKFKKALLVWPRQVGKDTSCYAYLVKRAAQEPGNYFYIFPTKEMARKAVWEKVLDNRTPLLDLLPLDQKYGLVARLSNVEMSIKLTNGSTIRFVGLDTNPNAIRGVTPTGVVFSEFAFSDPEAYKALIPAMRRERSWVIMNSTPNGRNHFYDMYEGAKLKDSGWYVSYLQGLFPDRANYIHIEDQAYFSQLVAEGQMSWEDIEREYGCSFSSGLKGSYYSDQIEQARQQNRVGQYPYDPTMGVYTYWDIGVRDDTAVWFVQHKQRASYIIDYFEAPGLGTDQLAQMLKGKDYYYTLHVLPHDAGNAKQGKDITTVESDLAESLGDFAVTGDVEVIAKWPSLQAGINATRKVIPRCYFNEETTEKGIEKLELYHRKYDKKRRVFMKEPVHDNNSHAADAFRTFAQSEDESFNHRYGYAPGDAGGGPTNIVSDYDPFI